MRILTYLFIITNSQYLSTEGETKILFIKSITFNMYANSRFVRREFAFDIVKIPFPVKIFKHHHVRRWTHLLTRSKEHQFLIKQKTRGA